MGATSQSIGFLLSAQTFFCLCIYIAITYMWYWSKSINFTVVSQTVRPIVDVGLWRICSGVQGTSRSGAQNCANIDPLHMPSGVVPTFVHFIRAFMIIAIILNLVAFIASCLSNSCSTLFQGKTRGRVALTSAILDLIANLLVLLCVSWWAGRTLAGRSMESFYIGMGQGGTGFGGLATTLQFTIGSCVIIGWCFGSLGLVCSCIGLWSFFATDFEMEDKEQIMAYNPSMLASNSINANTQQTIITNRFEDEQTYKPSIIQQGNYYQRQVPQNQNFQQNNPNSSLLRNPQQPNLNNTYYSSHQSNQKSNHYNQVPASGYQPGYQPQGDYYGNSMERRNNKRKHKKRHRSREQNDDDYL